MKEKIGRVLVVGAGVSGIQASLDLSNSYKVYLLENKEAIGGTMAQLDKTFPTNDCSMCILSPKLVETASNPNIELLTKTKILSCEGEAGNFKIKVVEEPRFVNLQDCKGCGDCAKACPVNLPNTYEENLTKRKAIFRLYEQAVPGAYGITKYGTPPCRSNCPLHVNPQGYLALISKGKYEEALKLVREQNPFPNITGRICSRPCEDNCTRQFVEESLAIDMLKRFVGDYEIKNGKRPEIIKPPFIGKKVAIIGSGPSGLMASYELRMRGYSVTVYEKLNEIGGMLRYGIPSYRLPRDILDYDLQILKDSGIELKVNQELGVDFTIDELKKDYDAVFVAIGTQKSKDIGVKGETLENVCGAVELLRDFNLKKLSLDENIRKACVIGGGNAAMDAARTLLRLGLDEVRILYRRTKAEMPANKEEIEEAEEEGIVFNFLSAPLEIIGEDKVKAIKLQKMRLGEPDSSGRRRPIPVEGEDFILETDLVIKAISQEIDLKDESLKIEKGVLISDSITLQVEGKIFSGGDATRGPATYIEAMGDGRRAAISIDRYLEGKDLYKGREFEGPYKSEVKVETIGIKKEERAKPVLNFKKNLRGDFSEVNSGLLEAEVQKEAERCLNCGGCSECMECVSACEAKVILHDMLPKERTLEVGSIILSPGFEEFMPDKTLREYGYGLYKNVITSIQFERILSASGPYLGKILRPSDNEHPKRIAWIQCVGSRDKNNPYCSSVCCMYATKEAVIAKEHEKNIDATIFYMDIRSYGKDFDKYIEKAKDEYKVRYMKSRIASIEETKNSNLKIRYEDDTGILNEEGFDLVVLSVGFKPSASNFELERVFGISLNEFGFAKTDETEPLITNKEGIYVAGAFAGPKDIPESVAEGSSAAFFASSLLKDEKGKELVKKEYPAELEVIGEKPRVGVFVCHCGLNIGSVINVKEVAEYAKNLPYVAYSEDNLYTCSKDAQERIKNLIKEQNLNRVVVASCSPRTHETIFQQTIREAGLNKYLFEMANIRDQGSWVHMEQKEDATVKAKELIKVAVSKAKDLKPLYIELLPITRRGLVIGGGITGMRAALGLAEEGYETYLVEREKVLGGNANHIHFSLDKKDINELLASLKERVLNNPLIRVYLDTTIENIEGFVGNYKTTLSNKDQLEHGVVIVATGGVENRPEGEYLLSKNQSVLTQRDFEEKIFNGEIKTPKSVVMINCVDSRNEKHPYCSRICCSESIKNALKIKNISPKTDVFILYRDIRTYGFKELYYQEAREKGVIFINYDEEEPPQATERDGRLRVSIFDKILKKTIELSPDYLVLSVGILPQEGREEISKMLKVPLNQDGFFLEAHMKLRPVDFATDGVFLAGLSHSPKTIEESILQAEAAVSRAVTVLTKEGIEAGGKVAYVRERLCVGCGVCEAICPASAIKVQEKKILGHLKRVAEVNSSLCKGCGACSGGCKSNAIDIEGFTDEEVSDSIEWLFKEIELV